jgi:surface antigen
MRFAPRRSRRASLTRIGGLVGALLVGLTLFPGLVTLPAGATIGTDDYPANLKNAAQDAVVDPWNFYNRECTSFVAWRLNNDAGLPFHNYYLGPHWGDASHWKAAAVAAGIAVDMTARVGAVAWWAAGSAGSSRGHVAWVKDVTSSSITIEEYNYLRRGFYDQRTISTTSSVYPTGFIHLGDTPLTATVRPAITGTAQVGTKLTTSTGTWTPTGATLTYQWYASGVAIAGATTRTFTPRAEQQGLSLQFAVTATKPGFRTTTVRTAKTTAVVPGTFTMSAPPAITGEPKVGVQLSATPGSWAPVGTYAYQWYADGAPIAGAATSILTPTAAEKGKAITVVVTSTKAGYTTATGTSTATADVAPGTFANTAPPTISGTPQVGQPLTAAPGTWSPTATYAYAWIAGGTPIAGATGASYIPVAGDLRKTITVQVTASQPGYTSATVSSAATNPVAPGTFLNTSDPAISGTPRVGVELTASPGTWSPQATLSYQWLADGVHIAGATGRTFTPTPTEYQHKLTVEVTARRPGYLTGVAPSAATAPVAPGTISAERQPAITGRPWVGSTLTADPGTWNVTPGTTSYQWLADGTPISGATAATYEPTQADLRKHLTVVVTVAAPAYQPASGTSAPTAAVTFGRTSYATGPKLTGPLVYGETLTVTAGAPTPSAATPTYQWYRGSTPITGATAASYRLGAADVGRRINARVTLAAPDWDSSTAWAATSSTSVRSRGTLTTQATRSGRRALLTFTLTAPGVRHPNGELLVFQHGAQIGRTWINGGHGQITLRLPPGRHWLALAFDGGKLLVPLRTTYVLG